MLSIARATENDAATLFYMEQQSALTCYTQKDFTDVLRHEGCVGALARVDGVLCAYGMILPGGEVVCNVLEAYRGQGIATALCAHLLESAPTQRLYAYVPYGCSRSVYGPLELNGFMIERERVSSGESFWTCYKRQL